MTLHRPGGAGPAPAQGDRYGSLLTAVAARLGRHTSVYAGGFAATLALSLVSVAVLTRYLTPGEFGRLGVLLVFAALLTILYNLGSLQGAFHRVYGSSGEEEATDPEGDGVAGDKRRALGTALAFTVLIAGTGTAVVVALAPAVAEIVTGDRGDEDLVILAAASGALGSVWRLVSNVPRLERRPVLFAVLSNLRPLLVIGAAVPLVVSGAGVEGVLVATLGGTLACSVVGLVVCRGSFRPAFRPVDAWAMVRHGAPFVPVIASFWVIQNVDLYVVTRFASDHDAGLYRLASRLGNLASYLVSAFLMAWTPLQRTSLFAAAEQAQPGGAMRSDMATYFVIVGCGALVALVTASDLLIGLAGPGYGDAAPLIPLLALGFLVYGAFVVTQRVVRYPQRRRAYPVIATLCAVVFLAAALALTPAIGTYGAALSPVIAFGAGTAVLIALSQRGPAPVPFHWRRMATALAVAVACVAVAVLGAWRAGELRPLVDLVALVAYPVGLVATGVLPRAQLRALREVARSLFTRAGATRDTGPAVAALAPDDRALLRMLLRERLPPERVAAALGLPEAEVEGRLTAVLRGVAGLAPGPRLDGEVGAYLLMRASAAERDAVARGLWEQGVEPMEIDALETAVAELRRSPARYWDGA